jgi:hypothetical protein
VLRLMPMKHTLRPAASAAFFTLANLHGQRPTVLPYGKCRGSTIKPKCVIKGFGRMCAVDVFHSGNRDVD